MSKLVCLNLASFNKESLDKYNFDNIYFKTNQLNKEISKLESETCLVFYGESIENIIYKKFGIIDNLLNQYNLPVLIEGIEIKQDGIYDFFNESEIINYFSFNQYILMSNQKVIDNVLEDITFKKFIDNKIIRTEKTHLLFKIYNNEKIIYILDLATNNIKLLNIELQSSQYNFLNNTIKNFSKIFCSNYDIKIDKTCNLYKALNNIKNFYVIGIVNNDIKSNENVFELALNINEIKIINKDNLKVDKRNLMIVPYKSNNNEELNNFTLDDKFPLISLNNILSEKLLFSLPTNLLPYDIFNIPLNRQKKEISDEDLRLKLETMNKILYRDVINNYIKMSNYDDTNIKNINNDVKRGLINTCEVILKELNKY
jgi:hypothetical protein